MDFERGFQNLICPGVDWDCASERLAIEAAHVALRIVEAHEPVHLRNGVKRLVDGLLPLGRSRTRRSYLDESSK